MYKVFVIKKKDEDKWNIKNIELYHHFMKDWMNDGGWTINGRIKNLLEKQKNIKLGKIKKRKYKNNEYIYYLVYKDRIIVDNYKELDFESGAWFRFNEHNQYLRHWVGSGVLSFIVFMLVSG